MFHTDQCGLVVIRTAIFVYSIFPHNRCIVVAVSSDDSNDNNDDKHVAHSTLLKP